MRSPKHYTSLLLASTLLAASTLPVLAEGEVNLYSSRHYDTDERLYADFEEATGIKINRIEAGADELIERLKSEGELSPADVLLTVDAGRIWRAEKAGLLQATESDILEAKIPAALQQPENLWFGFSTRARMIFFAKDRVSEAPNTYADLADPKYKGKICARSSSNIYMLSLMASRIAHDGEEAATNWAEGLYANFAREPQGGDTDQLRGIISGECDIAISNSYYFARALRKEVDGLSDSIDQIGWIFPDQYGRGTHVNISAGGIAANAPNKENAVKFLEYLASDSAQNYLAAGNDEFPVVEGVAKAASVTSLGEFKADDLNLSALGENQAKAQEIYNQVGYK